MAVDGVRRLPLRRRLSRRARAPDALTFAGAARHARQVKPTHFTPSAACCSPSSSSGPTSPTASSSSSGWPTSPRRSSGTTRASRALVGEHRIARVGHFVAALLLLLSRAWKHRPAALPASRRGSSSGTTSTSTGSSCRRSTRRTGGTVTGSTSRRHRRRLAAAVSSAGARAARRSSPWRPLLAGSVRYPDHEHPPRCLWSRKRTASCRRALFITAGVMAVIALVLVVVACARGRRSGVLRLASTRSRRGRGGAARDRRGHRASASTTYGGHACAAQRRALEGYGWVDRSRGVYASPSTGHAARHRGGRMRKAGSLLARALLLAPVRDSRRHRPERGGASTSTSARSAARPPLRRREGRRVRLGDYFDGGKPVLLVLAYYRCPMLCGLVLHAAAGAAGDELEAGRQVPRGHRQLRPERQSVEAERAQTRCSRGAPTRAAALAVPHRQQRGHRARSTRPWLLAPSATTRHGAVRAPGRRSSCSHRRQGLPLPLRHLLPGARPQARPPRGRRGRIGSALEQVLMRCYGYDPATRRYGLYVAGFMRVGGVVILVAVGLLAVLWRRSGEARGRRRERAPAPLLFLPEQGSTLAASIDALHYFVIASRCSAGSAVTLADHRLHRPLPPRAARPAHRARARAARLEVGVVGGLLALFILWWVPSASASTCACATPPEDAHGGLRHRQAVDVEVRLPRRAAARSACSTCPAGPPGEAAS